MADPQEMLAWRGREVIDVDGDKIGRLEEIYLDSDTDEPHWAAVKTGLIGNKLSLIPLTEAVPRGDHLAVPFDKRTVKGAPNIDTGAELSAEEESSLYRYYGMDSRHEDERHKEGASAERGHQLGDRDRGGHRGEGRGSELGRAIGEAARNVGQAAVREARRRDEPAERDRDAERGGRSPHDRGDVSRDERAPGDDPRDVGAESERRTDGERRKEQRGREEAAPVEPAETGSDRRGGRQRRVVTTEYLSDTGEVERRETTTEEDRPLGEGEQRRP